MTNCDTDVRTSVRGLVLGMYVSRLDRPWLETSFPLQGLKITCETELQKLQRVCGHVYVDTARGPSPELRYREYDPPPASEIARLRKNEWTLQTGLADELGAATAAHDSLKHSIDEVMADLEVGRALDLPKLKAGVDAMVESIVRNPSAFAWLKEIKRRDSYSYQHALGCAIWAASFGRHLGLDKSELQSLALGGLLCDVGKTLLPEDLLLRHGPLSDDEAGLVRRHVQHSLDIVEQAAGLPPAILEMVATHHERHDGSGYPWGLKGTAIPIFGRIMGLVDSYDAMTGIRPYARSRSPHQAVTELYEHRGSLFQAELVEQFIQSCGIYPTGSLVELTTGQVGVITGVHTLKRLRPKLMLLLDADKSPLSQFLELDMGEVDRDAQGHPLAVKCGLAPGAYGIDPAQLFLD